MNVYPEMRVTDAYLLQRGWALSSDGSIWSASSNQIATDPGFRWHYLRLVWRESQLYVAVFAMCVRPECNCHCHNKWQLQESFQVAGYQNDLMGLGVVCRVFGIPEPE